MGRFQKLSVGAICTFFLASILARVALGGGADATANGADYSAAQAIPIGAQGLVPGDQPALFPPAGEGSGVPLESEPGGLEALLPVFTEASFFAMMGFALGYASRKVVKLAMIFLAAFLIILQLLSYGGVTTIDWGRLVEILNDWILNLKENQTITDVLTDRVPSAGSLIAGYFLGFRRG